MVLRAADPASNTVDLTSYVSDTGIDPTSTCVGTLPSSLEVIQYPALHAFITNTQGSYSTIVLKNAAMFMSTDYSVSVIIRYAGTTDSLPFTFNILRCEFVTGILTGVPAVIAASTSKIYYLATS